MKNAIVTGGTKGIGRGIAEMLLREGYSVTATYAHDTAGADKCREEWERISARFEVVKCDQSDPEAVGLFTERMKASCPHLDCLVCNAGTTLRKGLTEMTNREWEHMMQVNVNSNVCMIRDLYGNLVSPPPLWNRAF